MIGVLVKVLEETFSHNKMAYKWEYHSIQVKLHSLINIIVNNNTDFNSSTQCCTQCHISCPLFVSIINSKQILSQIRPETKGKRINEKNPKTKTL